MAYDVNSGTWSLYLDGSDVGLNNSGGLDINAFHINADGSILMSFVGASTIPDVGSVDDSDIVRFVPTSLGATTAGTFELYFDGSDVGLSSNGEDVDAIGFAPDGSLVISTIGNADVGIGRTRDEDLLKFTASSLGANTSGSWSLYFDGSDVGLTDRSEDVFGTWLDSNGDIYLTTNGTFSVSGAAGDGADIIQCVPGSLGSSTSCSFSLYWDGSTMGFAGEVMDGLFISR
jgi:hypothetical protein